jgi:hypothetical protein
VRYEICTLVTKGIFLILFNDDGEIAEMFIKDNHVGVLKEVVVAHFSVICFSPLEEESFQNFIQ